MPRQTFGREFLHRTLFSMAAAYLYHIAQNHAFVDGNKRVALTAALVFLRLNRHTIDRESEQLYHFTMGMAEVGLDKEAVAAALEAVWTAEHEGAAGVDAGNSTDSAGSEG